MYKQSLLTKSFLIISFKKHLLLLLVVVAVAELLVMWFLQMMHELGWTFTPLQESLLDALLLSSLTAPFLWWFLQRPLILKLLQVQEEAEEASNLHRQLHNALNEHALVSITDLKGIILSVNDNFSRVSGYTKEELIGQNHRIINSGYHEASFFSDLWQTIANGAAWQGVICNRNKAGSMYWVDSTIIPLLNKTSKPEHYLSIRRDITKVMELQQQLAQIAYYDPLTSLPNHILLNDRLNQAMMQCQRHQQSLAVALLDLDGFKAINEAYGSSVGDELLVLVSQRMKETLLEVDTLARIGGDEFVIVLDGLANIEDCRPILERLLQAVAAPVTLGTIVIEITVSIGVTFYLQDNIDAEQLIRHADQAMYIAKQAGKNCYHLFDTAQDDAINSQQKIIGNIRSALEQHELVLYYQPKVNMRSGEVVGAEALIRWQRPNFGLLSPAEFLPAIENHAVSLELGEWVIDTALTQISQWQSMGLKLPVSVNISAYQLQQPNFTTRLEDLLAAHPEVDPSYLELEVLETSVIHNISLLSSTMKACLALGIRFSLDDFGTGYSSLTYLRRLPAYLIKIDQSFVRDMLIDADDLAIINGVIGLAKAFNREVIAEGVETIDHGVAMLRLGCDLAQGYGIARPMPASDIPAWATNWRPDAAWQALNLTDVTN